MVRIETVKRLHGFFHSFGFSDSFNIGKKFIYFPCADGTISRARNEVILLINDEMLDSLDSRSMSLESNVIRLLFNIKNIIPEIQIAFITLRENLMRLPNFKNTSNNNDISNDKEIIDSFRMDEFLDTFIVFLTHKMDNLITHNQKIFFWCPFNLISIYFKWLKPSIHIPIFTERHGFSKDFASINHIPKNNFSVFSD